MLRCSEPGFTDLPGWPADRGRPVGRPARTHRVKPSGGWLAPCLRAEPASPEGVAGGGEHTRLRNAGGRGRGGGGGAPPGRPACTASAHTHNREGAVAAAVFAPGAGTGLPGVDPTVEAAASETPGARAARAPRNPSP